MQLAVLAVEFALPYPPFAPCSHLPTGADFVAHPVTTARPSPLKELASHSEDVAFDANTCE